MKLQLRALLLAAGLAAGAPASAQQLSLGLAPTDSASGLAHLTGRRFVFVCPAIDAPAGDLWGTDIYADDSAICTAAIHAGVLQFGQAAPVAIVIVGETASFAASDRNGVKSQGYEISDLAYRFGTTEPAEIAWSTTAIGIPRDYNQPVTVICPRGGTTEAGLVWGTDTYIAESPICLTAVHAGVITLDGGGPVVVTKAPGQETFTASLRNGVDSRSWSAWTEAFTVAAGQAAAAADDTGSTSRRIRLAGYTGTGEGVDIAPRTIRLSGYAGTGEGLDIVPRTIRIGGWTGSGTAP